MKLWAISDLHLGTPANLAAFMALGHYPDDWLILAGDIGERLSVLDHAFCESVRRFKQVIWVPGNHELWAVPEIGSDTPVLAGEARYRKLVELARQHGVLTPEDPYPLWPGAAGPIEIVPLFLLYDYSFGPPGLSTEEVVAWAREERAVAADETLLSPQPWPSREAWCAERCRLSEQRLCELDPEVPKVLINHFPLRRDLIDIPRVPRFAPWCGTQKTENWHRRFNAAVVVSGHLHVRRTDWRDGTRFEEVSLGYPQQWNSGKDLHHYLREILPG
jgi:3',5'-cyclic AMP phosphodiesterase CpdA